jgi:flagellar biogenesis protein FliO
MDAFRQIGGIALTLALLATALWWLRRRGAVNFRGGRGPRVMEVIESRGLAPGHTLHLVRVADRVMALATHSAGCTLLEARPWTELLKSIPPEVGS